MMSPMEPPADRDGRDVFEALGDEDAELLLEFVEEAAEQLELAEGALLELEKQPRAQPPLDSALRSLHSLKGAAGYVSLFELQELCHVTEELLGRVQGVPLASAKQHVDLAFDAVTLMRARLEELRGSCRARRVLPPSERVARFLERANGVMLALRTRISG